MKDLNELNHWRNPRWELAFYGTQGSKHQGVFRVPSVIDHQQLNVIASKGAGWEHVSVSRDDRCPFWREMVQIKREFFKSDETVMQLHPPEDEYIDGRYPGGKSRFCLHLWRPTANAIPRPPLWMVGARNSDEAKRHQEEADAYFAEHPLEEEELP